MVDRFEKFSFSISEVSRYWHKIAASEMERYGLKGPYVVYFTLLYRYPDGVTAAKLAELCSKDKSDVSRAIAVLEKKGFVCKESHLGNLYRAPIKLTETGRDLAEHLNLLANKSVAFAGKDLSPEHRDIFYASLDSIVSNLRQLSIKGLDEIKNR